jgi:hypothetical protein
MLFANAADALQQIVDILNSTEGSELRQLVKLWQRSGPNLARLFANNPRLWIECLGAFKPVLMPTTTGNADLQIAPNLGAPGVYEALGPVGLRHKAVILFNTLLLNPFWKKLAGPCARCGNYYVKKRGSQYLKKRGSVYCSQRCGSAATALPRTRERYAAERKKKLRRVTKAIEKWDSLEHRPSLGWKAWVAKRADVDSRFITRAINKAGDLRPPKRESPRRQLIP